MFTKVFVNTCENVVSNLFFEIVSLVSIFLGLTLKSYPFMLFVEEDRRLFLEWLKLSSYLYCLVSQSLELLPSPLFWVNWLCSVSFVECFLVLEFLVVLLWTSRLVRWPQSLSIPLLLFLFFITVFRRFEIKNLLHIFFTSFRVYPIWVSLDTCLYSIILTTFGFCFFFTNFVGFFSLCNWYPLLTKSLKLWRVVFSTVCSSLRLSFLTVKD